MLKRIKALMQTVNKLVCVEMELNRLKSDDQYFDSQLRIPEGVGATGIFSSLESFFFQGLYYIFV